MQKYQWRGCCYGWHTKTRFHQFLKEIDKGKTSDDIPVRVGKKQRYALQNYYFMDSFYSSCHKNWKYQTKNKKQWMK